MTAENARDLPPIPDTIERVHVIGICGTAMGSLAGMLTERGYEVRGSDAGAYPPMSTWLEHRGISIMEGYVPEHLDWGPDLVVVGNICRRDNPEAVAAVARGLPALSLPEVLRELFIVGHDSLVVTGTHGKTTTSSILAWMLESAGRDPGFMIGGITGNFAANFKLGQGRDFVVEGDEYDTAYFDKVPKFWHYLPFRATINNIEFDHGDIYPDIEAIQRVFDRFAAMVDPSGSLWVNGDDPRCRLAAQSAQCRVRTFGLGPGNDLRAEEISASETGVEFVVMHDGRRLAVARSPMAGHHNVRNVLGAMALAMDQGVPAKVCVDSLGTFRSVKKRQELVGEAGGVKVYDDFAHHPTAVRETVAAMRARHPTARLWGVFEAKSNTSRMKIFQDAYPDALQACDVVVLSAPWKKDAEADASSRIDLPAVVDELGRRGVDAHYLPRVDEIVRHVAARVRPGDVVLGMSGSNFGGFHRALLAALK